MEKKCVCLLSGGIDSSVACMLAKEEGYDIYGLNFKRNRKAFETDYVLKFVQRIGIPCKVIEADITEVIREAQRPDLLTYVAMNGQSSEFLWGRNIIYLTLAANYAASIGASTIITGFAPHDANPYDTPSTTDYPDCHVQALQKLSTLLTLTLHRTTVPRPPQSTIQIISPLMSKVKTKMDVFRLGLQLGIKVEDTISCYEPIKEGSEWKSCGKCLACSHRKAALRELNKEGFDVPLYA